MLVRAIPLIQKEEESQRVDIGVHAGLSSVSAADLTSDLLQVVKDRSQRGD